MRYLWKPLLLIALLLALLALGLYAAYMTTKPAGDQLATASRAAG